MGIKIALIERSTEPIGSGKIANSLKSTQSGALPGQNENRVVVAWPIDRYTCRPKETTQRTPGLLCEIAAEPNPAAFAEFPLKAPLKADERN